MKKSLALVIALHAVVGGAFVSSPADPGSVDRGNSVSTVRAELPGLRMDLVGQKGRDSRPTRSAALYVPEGTAPSAFLDAGPFTATWTGYLNLDIRTKATFTAEGSGAVKVEIKGKVVLEGEAEELRTLKSKAHRIRKGRNPIVITYTPPKVGDARFRLYWRGTKFPREPLPPKLLTRDAAQPMANEREGRMAFAKRQCIACHQPEKELPVGSMPELTMGAPSLADIGARLQPAWVAEWIVNPRRMRHDATMPALFGYESLEAAVEANDTAPFDITAYLLSIGGRDQRPPDVDVSKTGGALFAKLGCISCHTRPDRPAERKSDRIPLNRVGRKFFSGALVEFLENPRRHWAWIRMPDFKLTDAEARELAGWMIGVARPPVSPLVHSGDAKRGAKLVQSLGCASCHDGLLEGAPGIQAPSFEAIFEVDWAEKGCASAKRDAKSTLDLGLDERTRSVLRDLGATGPASLLRRSPVEFTERQIEEARCTACHAYDDRPDLWATRVTETHDLHEDHTGEGPEGKVSQIRPTLTWLGEKLHGRWMASFISGDLPAMRPWLDARMPAFPTRAELMARGFAHAHGFPVTQAEKIATDPAMIEAGETLLSKDGFGCTACHGINDQKPYATFEFAAPNFEHVFRRLRHEYYIRWMWNPTRVEHRYRMPIYANPEDNETLQDEILDGVADRQFEAMWQYLQSIGK